MALPPGPPFFASFAKRKMSHLADKIVYIEEKNGTMIPGAKNAARLWSSFVCSLSVALFRDVLEML